MSEPAATPRVGIWLDNLLDGKFDRSMLAVAKEFHGAFLVAPLRPEEELLLHSEACMESQKWNKAVFGRVSSCADNDDTTDVERLREEFEWSKHLNLPRVVLCLEESQDVVSLSRAVSEVCHQQQYPYTVLCTVPCDMDGLAKWRRFHALLSAHARDMCHVMPVLAKSAGSCDVELVHRWRAAALRALCVHPDVLQYRSSDTSALCASASVETTEVLMEFLKTADINVCTVLTSDDETKAAHDYLENLVQFAHHAVYEASHPSLRAVLPYRDVLQTPLQPLAANLDSATYEVFETDPVKYRLYEEAVCRALQQRQTETVTVLVVGAGRGPLVDACLRASRRCKVAVRILAVEKNRCAFQVLKRKLATVWQGAQVQLVSGDMRDQNLPLADVVVSELLGSSGCNELSPECLDPLLHQQEEQARRQERPGPICVPQQYATWLAPIESLDLHRAVRSMTSIHGDSALEMPYVTFMHRFWRCAEPQKCWEFQHDIRDDLLNASRNERCATLRFPIGSSSSNTSGSDDVVIRGLAGYFHSMLFEQPPALTIVPTSHDLDDGMQSWFPLLLPLHTPLTVKSGTTLEVRLWRRVRSEAGHGKVWYEWAVTSPVVSRIHNSDGHAHSMSF